MSNNSKTVAAESASPVKAGKKMGIVRFLQLYPQKSGIAALLKSKYASTVMTETEWKAAVDTLLQKKVK